MISKVVHKSILYEQGFDDERGCIVMGYGTRCGIKGELPDGHYAMTLAGIGPNYVNCERCLGQAEPVKLPSNIPPIPSRLRYRP